MERCSRFMKRLKMIQTVNRRVLTCGGIVTVLVVLAFGLSSLRMAVSIDEPAPSPSAARNAFTFFEHPGCSRPCVFGIETARTTLTQVEHILAERNSRYDIRPAHIGGAGVYAREYDWDNPTVVRIYDTHFPETHLILNDENIVSEMFLAGGIVCPAHWFETYPAPDWLQQDDTTLTANYRNLRMTIIFNELGPSATITIGEPHHIYDRNQVVAPPRFPEDVGWQWTRSCDSWDR